MSSNKSVKSQKLMEKERIKAEKLASKERIKAEKLALKEREKAEKLALKEREKAEKLALKEREQFRKLMEKERIKAEKLASKEREKAEKLITQNVFEMGIKEGKKQEKKKQQKKIERDAEKFEIKKESIEKLVIVARQLQQNYREDTGFRVGDICEKYIELHGNINPYSTKPAEDGYDIRAAIRGLIYESSPSSLQHWFRFGERKGNQQISPWIFANKDVAIINNNYGWQKTSNDMINEKRQSIGRWLVITENNPQFGWNEDKYGPLPTNEQLSQCEQSGERRVGIRNH
jgi:hypothetical protein